MPTSAHKIQQAIDRDALADRAEAARRLGITRARMTQILDLTLLAPDIQEEILFLQARAPRPDLPRSLEWAEQHVARHLRLTRRAAEPSATAAARPP